MRDERGCRNFYPWITINMCAETVAAMLIGPLDDS